jgi:hypothetical protein
MFNHPVIMPCWHKWICDHNPAEYERVPKGSISHQHYSLLRNLRLDFINSKPEKAVELLVSVIRPVTVKDLIERKIEMDKSDLK